MGWIRTEQVSASKTKVSDLYLIFVRIIIPSVPMQKNIAGLEKDISDINYEEIHSSGRCLKQMTDEGLISWPSFPTSKMQFNPFRSNARRKKHMW